jgi:hypothetical protein
MFTFVKPTKLKYAEIDPERKIMLDINRTNNSMLLEPQSELPAAKWAAKWLIWLQDFIQTLTFMG